MTGNYDQRGGNVELPAVSAADMSGDEFLAEGQRDKTLGLDRRPLGAARFDKIISADIYRAILDRDPYPVRGLVSFGSNLIMAHADGETAAKGLKIGFEISGEACSLLQLANPLSPLRARADLILRLFSILPSGLV